LVKTFGIFFVAMGIFMSIIAYLYLKEQKNILHQQLFSIMKEFNFDFKNPNLSMDILPKNTQHQTMHLHIKDNEVFALFPINKINDKVLKVIYPHKMYKKKLGDIELKILWIYLLSLLFLGVFSLIYSLYALKPMKKALHLMDEFFNDIVHDLNTPITSILLNANFLSKTSPSQEIEKIELSAKRISSLYKNFELINENFNEQYTHTIDLIPLVQNRVDYYQKIYTDIQFNIEGDSFYIDLPNESLTRILDNIISNACKYNTSPNQVFIKIHNHSLSIRDTGIGMKEPQRVFERYYKESHRGIGIGMNIVKKLCEELHINIEIKSQLTVGREIILTFKMK
ncbi:MAG: HAMP domain-containing sensor histidine kinase, partial [Campylobacterota bacterium]|nr:HAMP domain-containing sensor histidine kinase [Campylobacterota bacterium]